MKAEQAAEVEERAAEEEKAEEKDKAATQKESHQHSERALYQAKHNASHWHTGCNSTK